MELGSLKFDNAVVQKPWGYEYLVYQNAHVAIWYLHIKAGHSTSLHCHPGKKTGLILLDGEALVSFLNDSMQLKSLSKVLIRPGLFHATKALSPEGVGLLEIETPPHKEDLVRFEDRYGREGKTYEGPDRMVPIPDDFIRFRDPEPGQIQEYRWHGNLLTLEKISDVSSLDRRPADEIIAILEGTLVAANGEIIVSAGEVGPLASLVRLAETFSAPQGITLLTVRRGAEAVPAERPVKGRTVDARPASVRGRGPQLGMIPGLAAQFPKAQSLAIFRQTCLNRFFELECARVFNTGIMKIPIYLSVGQEHIPAALASVTKDFLIFAQHRCHSYYLSFGGSIPKLIDELLGRPTGCARGMGGSASIQDPSIGMYGHSGLMGDQIPIAVGAALGSGRRVLAVSGDASVEEDYVFGAMGYTATKKLPVLFLCEDNGLSILTKVETRRSWNMTDVARSLGMAAADITDDPWLVAHYVETFLPRLPAFINVRTCRHLWHNGTGSDGDPEWNRFELFKEELGRLGLSQEARQIEEETRRRVLELWEQQLRRP